MSSPWQPDDPPAPCHECGGSGFIEEVVPKCCGNVTSGGECRGWCVLPDLAQRQCEHCGGNGFEPPMDQNEIEAAYGPSS